jgi:hypothetical protein
MESLARLVSYQDFDRSVAGPLTLFASFARDFDAISLSSGDRR